MKTHKELKEEYKQMKFRMGIFLIRNINNGKIFIGSSTDLKATWFSQKLQLNTGTHQNFELQKEWKESGAENFTYEIIDEIKQTDDDQTDYSKELKGLEKMYIEEFQPFDDKGYHKKPRL